MGTSKNIIARKMRGGKNKILGPESYESVFFISDASPQGNLLPDAPRDAHRYHQHSRVIHEYHLPQ